MRMGVITLAAMPGTNRLRALLALLAAVAALSGCGSDEISGEIPPDNAARLNAALGGVSSAVASQNCEEALSQADQFVAEVNDLPIEAGEELKAELRSAGDHLSTLVSDECPSTGTTEPTTEPTTTEPTTTEPTTTTTTTTTEPTTTTDETQTTTTTDETTPDGNGGSPGNGGTGGTGGGSGDEGGD
jgi:hypothetical protein